MKSLQYVEIDTEDGGELCVPVDSYNLAFWNFIHYIINEDKYLNDEGKRAKQDVIEGKILDEEGRKLALRFIYSHLLR